MKSSMLDTDILSEFFRGNEKVISKVDEHLKEFSAFADVLHLQTIHNIECCW